MKKKTVLIAAIATILLFTILSGYYLYSHHQKKIQIGAQIVGSMTTINIQYKNDSQLNVIRNEGIVEVREYNLVYPDATDDDYTYICFDFSTNRLYSGNEKSGVVIGRDLNTTEDGNPRKRFNDNVNDYLPFNKQINITKEEIKESNYEKEFTADELLRKTDKKEKFSVQKIKIFYNKECLPVTIDGYFNSNEINGWHKMESLHYDTSKEKFNKTFNYLKKAIPKYDETSSKMIRPGTEIWSREEKDEKSNHDGDNFWDFLLVFSNKTEGAILGSANVKPNSNVINQFENLKKQRFVTVNRDGSLAEYDLQEQRYYYGTDEDGGVVGKKDGVIEGRAGEAWRAYDDEMIFKFLIFKDISTSKEEIKKQKYTITRDIPEKRLSENKKLGLPYYDENIWYPKRSKTLKKVRIKYNKNFLPIQVDGFYTNKYSSEWKKIEELSYKISKKEFNEYYDYMVKGIPEFDKAAEENGTK